MGEISIDDTIKNKALTVSRWNWGWLIFIVVGIFQMKLIRDLARYGDDASGTIQGVLVIIGLGFIVTFIILLFSSHKVYKIVDGKTFLMKEKREYPKAEKEVKITKTWEEIKDVK